jgi:hypothetical protein
VDVAEVVCVGLEEEGNAAVVEVQEEEVLLHQHLL